MCITHQHTIRQMDMKIDDSVILLTRESEVNKNTHETQITCIISMRTGSCLKIRNASHSITYEEEILYKY